MCEDFKAQNDRWPPTKKKRSTGTIHRREFPSLPILPETRDLFNKEELEN